MPSVVAKTTCLTRRFEASEAEAETDEDRLLRGSFTPARGRRSPSWPPGWDGPGGGSRQSWNAWPATSWSPRSGTRNTRSRTRVRKRSARGAKMPILDRKTAMELLHRWSVQFWVPFAVVPGPVQFGTSGSNQFHLTENTTFILYRRRYSPSRRGTVPYRTVA